VSKLSKIIKVKFISNDGLELLGSYETQNGMPTKEIVRALHCGGERLYKHSGLKNGTHIYRECFGLKNAPVPNTDDLAALINKGVEKLLNDIRNRARELHADNMKLMREYYMSVAKNYVEGYVPNNFVRYEDVLVPEKTKNS
jgi:deoxyadenosine/deoxycytidine kinase